MSLLLPLLLACAGPTGADGDSGAAAAFDTGREGSCDASGGRMHWVLDSLAFTRVEDGVSDGFDLDADVSTAGGSGGCGIPDAVGPDGAEGVDNAFGRLIPALENTEFIGAEALINDVIRSGELMLVAELSGVESTTDDACVEIALRRATGEPLLGTDGDFLAGQTLDLDTGFESVEMGETAIVAASAVGAPFQTTLPVQVLNAELEFFIQQGAIRYDLHDDGTLSGVFAGGVAVDDILAVASTENIDPVVYDLLDSLLYAAADLAPDADGDCTQVSLGFDFTATPIYIYEDVWD